jgi:hypothetical protein
MNNDDPEGDKKEEVKESQNFLLSNEDGNNSQKKNLGMLADSQEDLDGVAQGENVLEGKPFDSTPANAI